ncbi:hypothetical protein HGH47_02615 [Treponema sp. OMZ 805]
MKSVHFRIPSYLIGSILIFISIAAAFGADVSSPNSPAVKQDAESKESVITVETVAGENPKTIHLYPFDQIPDSAEIREAIAASWFSAPIEKVIKKAPELHTDSKGNTFTVSGKYAEDSKNVYIISIIPNLTDYSLPEHNLVPQGTWMLYRRADTGAPLSIKIYPRENPALSVSLRPASQKAYSGKSFIDICLFNAYMRKDIAIGVPFETLYHISLLRLKALSQSIIPWDLFNPPRDNSPVKSMSRIVENLRYRLVRVKDGCFDHDGKPVHISNSQPQTELEITAAMNIDQIRSEVIGGVDSAGFAKWVIDGIIRPIAGQGTVVEALKRETDAPKTHFTRPYLDTENIFFGLDWIRNLGAAALSLNLKRTVYPDSSGLDVDSCPFALTGAAIPVSTSAKTGSVKQPAFLGYQRYAGYQTSYLLPLLYYFAIVEPDHFYLACISTVSSATELRTYERIAVFFPYFDGFGAFHLDIYEDGELIPVDEFIEKNKDAYTAMVRVRAPEKGLFNP